MVNETPVRVVLHPPTGRKTSWYAYWTGLTYSVSTGRADLNEAMKVVQGMLTQPKGKQPQLQDAVLSNEEFRDIQQKHFKKKQDQRRAAKTLKSVLEAIDAFELVTKLPTLALATARDCEAFQTAALELPKNWRHPNKRDDADIRRVSRNTIRRWLRELQAAFERCNRNAVPR